MHKGLAGTLPFGFGFVACKVNKVNGSGPGEEVQSAEKDQEREADEKIDLEVGPEGQEVVEGECGEVYRHQGNQWAEEEVHEMGYQVMVPEFDILETNGLLEIRQPGPG